MVIVTTVHEHTFTFPVSDSLKWGLEFPRSPFLWCVSILRAGLSVNVHQGTVATHTDSFSILRLPTLPLCYCYLTVSAIFVV